MSVDRLSNMVSSIKNASMASREFIEIPHSNVCEEVAKVLKNSGFLKEVKVFKEKGKSFKMLRLDIAYEEDGTPKISDIQRVSRPGRRIYRNSSEIRPVAGGYGVAIVSTSRGLVKDFTARNKKLGGEVICKVW